MYLNYLILPTNFTYRRFNYIFTKNRRVFKFQIIGYWFRHDDHRLNEQIKITKLLLV